MEAAETVTDPALAALEGMGGDEEMALVDDRLRLIFTCCHPALAMETRVALTLRMVAGLTVPEIGRASCRERV